MMELNQSKGVVVSEDTAIIYQNRERIAVLEHRLGTIEVEQKQILSKLDELLVLRNKGMGAFWLAAALFGTGIVGTIISLIQYMKS